MPEEQTFATPQDAGADESEFQPFDPPDKGVLYDGYLMGVEFRRRPEDAKFAPNKVEAVVKARFANTQPDIGDPDIDEMVGGRVVSNNCMLNDRLYRDLCQLCGEDPRTANFEPHVNTPIKFRIKKRLYEGRVFVNLSQVFGAE